MSLKSGGREILSSGEATGQKIFFRDKYIHMIHLLDESNKCGIIVVEKRHSDTISVRMKSAGEKMRLLVISDTHGFIEDAVEIYNNGSFDAIIHLGDNYDDSENIRRETGAAVIAVKGNCDFGHRDKRSRILKTDFGRILLVHGHEQRVKQGLTTLAYTAMDLDCQAVFFGHTHRAFYDDEGEVVMLNPGSLTYPYGIGERPSYAIAEIDEDGDLDVQICRLP